MKQNNCSKLSAKTGNGQLPKIPSNTKCGFGDRAVALNTDGKLHFSKIDFSDDSGYYYTLYYADRSKTAWD